MASIKPFKGIIYNERKIEDLSGVVAPPYDVIGPSMQETLYRANPYNIVRLILGKINTTDHEADNRYTRAKDLFNNWLKAGVMVQDETPAVYIYSQEYRESNKVINRIGFIALMRIEMEGAGKVLPHENTLFAPKQDRLNLIRQVRANLCPIFVLYDDAKHEILNILKDVASVKGPFIDIRVEGIRNRAWRLDEEGLVKKVEDLMSQKDIFIADGHHRYEVARLYAAGIEKSDAPQGLKDASKYLMVYFVESNDDLLTILPTHRLVKDTGDLDVERAKERLERSFFLSRVNGIDALMLGIGQASPRDHLFGAYFGKGEYYILKLKDPKESDGIIKGKPEEWKSLDVVILHQFILQQLLHIRDEDENIGFVKDPHDAVRAVDEGEYRFAFFLNPTKVSQVKRIAMLGERMPRKATYFYPKPLSGIVINKHAL